MHIKNTFNDKQSKNEGPVNTIKSTAFLLHTTHAFGHEQKHRKDYNQVVGVELH